MKTFLKHLLLDPVQRIFTALIVVFILGAGYFYLRPGPQPVITHPTPTTTDVVLTTDTLTPKEVVKFVTDDKEVKRLLDENKKLKNQITLLSETIATLKVKGEGSMTVIAADNGVPPKAVDPDTVVQPGDYVIRAGTYINYKDFRLDFSTDGLQGKYELTQQFEILQATGRDASGKPVNTVKLFEIGEKNERIPVTTLKTTNVFADDTRPSWHVGLTVQAGLGYVAQTADTSKKGVAGVAGIQWLKRGRTEAAEESSLSLLTPVAIMAGEDVEFGVLPVSVNLGRIKHQPFKDLWVSPFVGKNAQKSGVGRIGIVFTASF